MNTDDPRYTTLPDVNSGWSRSLQVIPRSYLAPDNALVTVVYPDRTTGGATYYTVGVKRKDLLDALGAEPDETDYREVIAENERLGRRLAEAIADCEDAERERDSALEELHDAAEAPEPEEPREDQDQIDRAWALETAGEALGRLAAVGALPKDWAGVPVLGVAEWILNGKPVDRG